jgi:hypothetical protein
MATTKRLAVLVFLLTAACGGGGSETTSAAAKADAQGDSSAGLSEFCQGNVPKIQLGSVTKSPAAVSSLELVMNCCEGVLLNFHAAELPTGRLDVMIRGMGGMVPSGDHDLAKLPAGFEVRLSNDATSLGEGLPATLTGSVRIDRAVNSADPYKASLCAEIHAPGQPLDGLRLYAREFPVARWGWHNRLSVKLLADPKITAQTALQQPLASLALDAEPLLGLSHIGWYSSDHHVHWGVLMGKKALLNRVGQVGTQGVPFVVEADGQRIYLGAFYSLVSSQSFAGPMILVEGIDDAGFAIGPSYPAAAAGADVRGDPRILKVLGEAGKLLP